MTTNERKEIEQERTALQHKLALVSANTDISEHSPQRIFGRIEGSINTLTWILRRDGQFAHTGEHVYNDYDVCIYCAD